MYDNSSTDWQALSQHYRSMFDGELENLAKEMDTLTEMAQQVLRAELKNRGLSAPGTGQRTWAETQTPFRLVRNANPGVGDDDVDLPESTGENEQRVPTEFTWKTPLRDCGSEVEARALSEVLHRAGIDNWIELPGRRGGALASPRVLVAADQLEQATEVASRPIPKEILDDLSVEAPEFESPHCPACHAEDPTLESTEPSNSWLCEACGKQWTEPIPQIE
jgi:hypothetical protein